MLSLHHSLCHESHQRVCPHVQEAAAVVRHVEVLTQVPRRGVPNDSHIHLRYKRRPRNHQVKCCAGMAGWGRAEALGARQLATSARKIGSSGRPLSFATKVTGAPLRDRSARQ